MNWELCKILTKYYMHKLESVPENEMHNIPFVLKTQRGHPTLDWRSDLFLINNKEMTCNLANFVVPVYHKVKIKESEKRNKYLSFARKLKKLWNMTVTVIPVVIGALGTALKDLERGME